MGTPKENRLSCEEIEALVPDLLYGELDSERAAQVRARLSECELEGKVAGYERLRVALRALPDEEPPAAITAQLMHAAAQQVEGKRKQQSSGGGLWARALAWFGPIGTHPGLAAAASVLLVGGVAGLLYMRGADRTGPVAPTKAEAPRGEAAVATPAASAPTPVPAVLPEANEAPAEKTAADPSGVAGGLGKKAAVERQKESAADSTRRGRGSVARPTKRPAGKADKAARLDVGSAGSGLLGGAYDGDADFSNSLGPVTRAPERKLEEARDEAGEREQAEPAKPDPEPQVEDRSPPPPPRKTSSKKKRKRASSSELNKLHGQAAAAAKAGDCARVRKLGASIERLDGVYYRDVFRRDAAIRACDGVAK